MNNPYILDFILNIKLDDDLDYFFQQKVNVDDKSDKDKVDIDKDKSDKNKVDIDKEKSDKNLKYK